ncbi:MAG: hypothetical protein ACO1QR_01540, partial [Chthoniobacteraceae bacterium]
SDSLRSPPDFDSPRLSVIGHPLTLIADALIAISDALTAFIHPQSAFRFRETPPGARSPLLRRDQGATRAAQHPNE